MIGIYVIRHASGRCYVGSAVNIQRRWDLHRSQLRREKHHSIKLQRAWVKYGEASFVFEVLEQCPIGDLIAREQHWIDILNAATKAGYNTLPAAGSTRGHKWSPEVVAKRNASLRGLKRSTESRQRIGAAKRGIPISDAQKAKLSAALLGRRRDPALVEKTAAANRGKARPPHVIAAMQAGRAAQRAANRLVRSGS